MTAKDSRGPAWTPSKAEPGKWPERWVCALTNHKWADWLDNGGRSVCTFCWKRVPFE